MTLKIKKMNLMDILFVLLLLTAEQFFYLFELPVSSSDIAVVIAVLMFAIYALVYKFKGIGSTPKEVVWLFAICMVLIFASAIRAHDSYGQGLKLGLLPQRMYLVFLAYFPIKNVIMKNERGVRFVINALVFFGTMAAIIYILQYLLFSGEAFLAVDYDYRFSEVRLRFSEEITLFSMFYSYYQIMNKPKLYWIANFGLHMFYYIVVVKGRTGFVVILATLVLLTFIFNRKKIRSAIITVGIMLVLLYAPIPIISDYLNGILEAVDSYESEEDVRYQGQMFYMQKVIEDTPSLLFGKGYVNLNSESATRISRAEDYYIVDNGYFGIAYYYGLLGVVWNIMLYLCMMKKAYGCWKGNRVSGDVGVGMSMVFVVSSILVPYIMYYHALIPMAVVLALPQPISERRRRKLITIKRKAI